MTKTRESESDRSAVSKAVAYFNLVNTQIMGKNKSKDGSNVASKISSKPSKVIPKQ